MSQATIHHFELLEYTCRGCGAPFKSISRTAKYCGPCRKLQVQRANQRHNHKRKRRKQQ